MQRDCEPPVDQMISMQIGIPTKYWGPGLGINELRSWFKTRGMSMGWSSSHSSSSGTGYTNGVSNKIFYYHVEISSIEDASLFKLHYPDCRVRIHRG